MTTTQLKRSMDRRFDRLDRSLKRRFEGIDHRFEGIDRRFEGIDRRFEQMHERFDETRRHFDVIAESLRDDLRLFADAIAAHTERLDQHDTRIGRLEGRLPKA